MRFALALALIACTPAPEVLPDPVPDPLPDSGTPDPVIDAGSGAPDASVATIPDGGPLQLDLHTATVSGTIRIDGAVPTRTNCPLAEVALRVTFEETTRGYLLTTLIPCTTSAFDFSVKLYRGTYKVSVTNLGTEPSLRTNLSPSGLPIVLAPALAVTSDLDNQTLNLVTAPVSGSILYNGQAPSAFTCPGPNAVVRFRETTLGFIQETSMTCTQNFAWSTRLPLGTYEVAVRNPVLSTNYGSNLPRTAAPIVVNPALQVTGPVTGQVLAVTSVRATGTIKLNGAGPTKTANCIDAARLTFEETTKGFIFMASVLCNTPGFDWTVDVVPGTYRVRIEKTGSNLPSQLPGPYANEILQLSANTTNLTLNLTPATVSGTVTLDGVAPLTTAACTSTGYALFVDLEEPTKNYSVAAVVPCSTTAFEWSATLFPGTYRVRVRAATGATNIPDAAPVRPAAMAAAPLVVTGPATGQVIALSTAMLSGTLKVDGAAPVKTASCTAGKNAVRITFYETTDLHEHVFTIPCTATSWDFSLPVMRGTYLVYVSSAYTELPVGDGVAVPSLVVAAPSVTKVLDLNTRSLRAVVTANGASPITALSCTNRSVTVRFESKVGALVQRFDVPCVTHLELDAKVYAGRYRVTVENVATDLPVSTSPAVAIDTLDL